MRLESMALLSPVSTPYYRIDTLKADGFNLGNFAGFTRLSERSKGQRAVRFCFVADRSAFSAKLPRRPPIHLLSRGHQ